jgi:pyruvate-formate lyase-activating enzyme
MQAYIANLSDDFNQNKIIDKSYIVYFSGNNFQNYNFKDFKSEHLIYLKDIKKDIENNLNNIDKIIFTGGEPCLQRLALMDISRFSKNNNIKTILFTNGTKPESLKSLINENLMDEINLILDAPFNEIFEHITKSKTFFKSSEEIFEDIKKSIEIINNSEIIFNIKTKLTRDLLINKNNIIEMAKIIEKTKALWFIDKMNNSDKFLESIKKMCLDHNVKFSNEL